MRGWNESKAAPRDKKQHSQFLKLFADRLGRSLYRQGQQEIGKAHGHVRVTRNLKFMVINPNVLCL